MLFREDTGTSAASEAIFWRRNLKGHQRPRFARRLATSLPGQTTRRPLKVNYAGAVATTPLLKREREALHLDRDRRRDPRQGPPRSRHASLCSGRRIERSYCSRRTRCCHNCCLDRTAARVIHPCVCLITRARWARPAAARDCCKEGGNLSLTSCADMPILAHYEQVSDW